MSDDRTGSANASELDIATEIEGFLADCGARNLSPNTVTGYRRELALWLAWQAAQGSATIDGLTPQALRRWMLQLGTTRAPGGVHSSYRVIKTFLHWAWREHELPWRNPIARLQAPRLPKEPLKPVPLEDLRAMVRVCDSASYDGARDQAMLLALLDTGCRASEFVSLNVADMDRKSGRTAVRLGKGGKSRVVFVGKRTRRALARYLRQRKDAGPDTPLWADGVGTRLTTARLRGILRQRAAAAGVDAPTPHSFRRAFALTCLRQGMDIYSLQRLMGHADLTVLQRYLNQTQGDLRETHRRAGPVDNLS